MSDPNDKTRIIRRSGDGGPQSPQPYYAPQPLNRGAEDTVYATGSNPAGGPTDPDATRILDRKTSPPPPPAPPAQGADPHTRLVHRPSRRPTASTEPNASDTVISGAQDQDYAKDPVVGWLVIVEGPGRGQCVMLGYGQNTIGREPGNRVALPFGDEEISRLKHAILTYDPRGRKFYIQHGDSTNLTYLGDTPVLAPTLLQGGEAIRIGDKTVLKFVPLCGDDFDWND